MRMTVAAVTVLSLNLMISPQVLAGNEVQIGVELVADGLAAPLDLTFAPDNSDRRFIVDQNGLVLILTPDNEVLETPFLDICDRVVIQSAFDERGLLGLAFHPDFADNGKFYVNYSAERQGPNICVDQDGNIPEDLEGCPLQHTRRVSEFTVDPPSANIVDPGTERVIFEIQWPGRKHNGGGLAFGPDGFLYIGLGDGGWVHGPDGADSAFNVDPDLFFGDTIAQDLTQLYGKILRIDVDAGDPYAIPADNPFVGDEGIPDEIFAWGFRNPFRISFDSGRPLGNPDSPGRGIPERVLRKLRMLLGMRHDGADGRPGSVGDGALRMFVSATAETLFEATYLVTGPGNFGWATKEGTHCIVRSSAFAPPELFSCEQDGECPMGPQVTFCGPDGHCTCSDFGPLGEPIRDPVIEYLNFAVEQPESQFPGAGFGRASLGGHIYRGREIPALRGKFVQGDFAVNFLDGQILVATPRETGLWDLERAFVFDADDPDRAGFMKAIGRDADGELYAITGNLTPTGLQGRIWKIVDASERGQGGGQGRGQGQGQDR